VPNNVSGGDDSINTLLEEGNLLQNYDTRVNQSEYSKADKKEGGDVRISINRGLSAHGQRL